jgi:hypothetical protein
MRTKHKTLLYVGLGLAAWYLYQKRQGNNIFGQPAAVTTASLTNNAATAAANASLAAMPIAPVVTA